MAKEIARKHEIDCTFRVGNVEAPIVGFNQHVFDYIISNGALCLTEGKVNNFKNAYKYLRTGGKMVVCTTVLKDKKKLIPDVEYPPGTD